ncbi:DUF6308 family protein [Nocardioides bruguierae]|uniref:DUF6308 family protein n=1 Tax=Nocardioides bruguierae TaxID=2945102 RepID=UPI002021A2EB|nr:DUF6308 family protein [Nocardioides bruguierae]MCL8026464.1 DUF6308 family protein [Nocardioides bruguierae]
MYLGPTGRAPHACDGRARTHEDAKLLAAASHDQAASVLACYYGLGLHREHKPFTGARFDTWDSTGTRADDVNRFTADDLVAVSFLSVEVPPLAAVELLDTRADHFAARLIAVGPDRDLATETEPWAADWPGWLLWTALMGLPGVGATIASKLYARKRPRLRPVYDTVVAKVIGSDNIWEPLRAELQRSPGLPPVWLILGACGSQAASAVV